MASIDFDEMQQMQIELQAKYGEVWGQKMEPDFGVRQLLWMIGEASEVGDIIKKEGEEEIMNNPDTRRHFVEEMTDVMMYFNDLMLCFHITPEELTEQYRKKHERNMNRW